MTGAGAVKKGKRAELELAKIIEARTGQRCFRVPMSGANDEISSFDLMGPVFHTGGTLAGYGVESKNHAKPQWGKWWIKAQGDGQTMGKAPALCIREEGGEWSVTISLDRWLDGAVQSKKLESELMELKKTPEA